MRSKPILILALLAITHGSMAADTNSKSIPLDFKGVIFGASPEETRSTLMTSMTSWICERGVDTGATGSCTAEGITFAQLPTRNVQFGYLEGRLSMVSANLDHNAFSNAVAALRTKYGAPGQTKQSTAANLAGARLPQVLHTWTVPKSGVITAELRGYAMDTAYVVYKSVEQLALDNAKQRSAKPDI